MRVKGIQVSKQGIPLLNRVPGSPMTRKPRFSHKDHNLVKIYYRIHRRVTDFFSDPVKATDWMMTKSMWFGGISPLDMINLYRGKKLENWIISQLDENEEPIAPIGFSK